MGIKLQISQRFDAMNPTFRIEFLSVHMEGIATFREITTGVPQDSNLTLIMYAL